MPAGKSFRTLNRDGSYNVVPIRRHKVTFNDLYHGLLSLSWPQFIAMFAGVYFAVNLVFAVGYFCCGTDALEGVDRSTGLAHFLDCFFFSVQTFATIGYGRISPHGFLANCLVTFEALAALLSLSLATGLLFARFSRPTARILFARSAVINSHDGKLSLLFRIANARGNQITQAEINCVLVIDEKTQEGESYRTFNDLKLERHRSPVFALSWTIVHEIDDSSPLRGHTVESLRAANVEVILSVTGIDDTFQAPIHARLSYVPDEILWHKRFVDILHRNPDGRIQVELDKIHDVTDAI